MSAHEVVLRSMAEKGIRFRLTYDHDYGIAHRRGWSMSIEGVQYTQFVPTINEAVGSAYVQWQQSQREAANEPVR